MSRTRLTEFAKKVRWVQWFICFIPLGGLWLKQQGSFLFPPLGTATQTAAFLALVLAGIASMIPWAVRLTKRHTFTLLCSGLLLLSSAIAYTYLSQRFVVSIQVPGGGQFSLSVGNERTPFANENFGADATDAEMLMARGPYENEVKKLWSEKSIDHVRVCLFISYAGALVSLNFVIGLFAGWDSKTGGR